MGPLLPFLILTAAFGGGAYLISKNKSRGPGCLNIVISPTEAQERLPELLAWAQKWEKKGPGASAQAAMIDVMNMMRPKCVWTKTTESTITNAEGTVYEWSEIMSLLEGKTMGDVAANPGLLDFTANAGGPQSSSQYGPLTRILFG